MAETKSERLLALMQALRRRRGPVQGRVLAEEMGVTLRTIYRDIAALRGLGAAVEGEAGIGYQLSDDFFLPPMALTREEIEALVLGLRTVIYGPDREMSVHASDVRAKTAASLPQQVREDMDAVGLFAVPRAPEVDRSDLLSTIRKALREELELRLDYADANGVLTSRTVWPISLGYLGRGQMLVAWCTLRSDFRKFWVDRMQKGEITDKRFPRPRRTLLHEWRQSSGMARLD